MPDLQGSKPVQPATLGSALNGSNPALQSASDPSLQASTSLSVVGAAPSSQAFEFDAIWLYIGAFALLIFLLALLWIPRRTKPQSAQ